MKNKINKIKLFFLCVIISIISFIIGFEKGKNLILKTILAKDSDRLSQQIEDYYYGN